MRKIFCVMFILSQFISFAQFQGNETLVKLELILLGSKKDTLSFVNLQDNRGIESRNKNYRINFFESKADFKNKNINERIVFLDPKLKNKVLEIGYNSYVNNNQSENIDKEFCSDLIIIIQKKRRTMKIKYKIYKQYYPYMPWIIKMSIPFKEGIFEVSDPESPKLISINDD